MMRINLLPWREARRLQRQRDLIGILVGVALVTCGIVFMGYTEIDNRIEFQKIGRAHV